MAGNYVRGSKPYEEFEIFIKENAKKVENTDTGTLYTLSEESVRKWNQPCNQELFDIRASDLIKTLSEAGYNMEEKQHSSEYTVEVRKYGGMMETRFLEESIYEPSENIVLTVTSDTINGNIYECILYRKKRNASIQNVIADIILYLSDDWREDKEATRKTFQKDAEDADDIGPGQGFWGYSYDDIGIDYYCDNEKMVKFTLRRRSAFDTSNSYNMEYFAE